MSYGDYNDLAAAGYVKQPPLMEAYRGVDVVAWQGRIERQIEMYVDENQESRNYVYADKLREFLKTWRANTFTGSINVETIDVLEAATAQLAVDNWRYQSYFSNLRDQLRKLKASVEELPFDDVVPPEQRSPESGPPVQDFGAEEKAPADEAGEEGVEDLPPARIQ